jgi:FkbM family methyltransferase
MKIFIDCGTNYCQGLAHFIDNLKIDHTWQVHSFEANPKVASQCLESDKFTINFHNKAVWTQNGFVNFKQFGDDGKSSGSLIAETGGDKGYADHHADITVESIDFYEFVSQFKEDEVYVKMDIEHAEYDILEDMVKRGWPKNIKEMWVEWHARMPHDANHDFFSERKKNILNSLADCGTVLHDWH